MLHSSTIFSRCLSDKMFVINGIYKSPGTDPKRQAIWTSGVLDIRNSENPM
jgi:hypothetical protein